jgi:archaemetzincin
MTKLTVTFLPALAVMAGAFASDPVKRSQSDALPTSASRPAQRYGQREQTIARQTARLVPLAEKLWQARPGEWLHDHDEPGQTFLQYVAAAPTVPSTGRNTVYVQPLGEFDGPHKRLLDKAVEFLGIYYSTNVRLLPELPLSVVPAGARRVLPGQGVMQIRTGYALERVLLPRLPADAFCMIGLTTCDLWPGDEWDFVLGSASLKQRVGIWSLYRFGDPAAGDEQYRLALLRTLKTASHETGHMFGMLHCTAYRCNMCGTDSLAERDETPLAMCPECLAKLCWASGCRPAERYGKLRRFYADNGLNEQAAWCDKAIAALSDRGATAGGRTASRPASRPAIRPAATSAGLE